MTDYGHEWEIEEENRRHFQCALCGVHEFSQPNGQAGPLLKQPCPERIVQEVVVRIRADLHAELQNANVIQAKRRHQDR